ncbi:ABC transporter substrate-binding protein [Metasolibacillus meyeri]|uniref:ABC transporter substrate-binding protein n=1 Tax=Metasolibacillus meyeri TaxID=1071052 RepID=A0AAW9NK04_9BACL|nr:ABC transporter substrate-binding protein [Metasolibacillus meyeri]MEC1178052.1 ABC transporter substrate-binding protein [Metasolibacillus meyeri]
MKKLLTIFMCAMLLLVACAEKEAEQPVEKEDATVNEQEQASNETEQEAQEEQVEDEGLTLENDGVDEAKFQELLASLPAEQPERIVITSVPLTEMLYLLDVEPVGVPTSTNPIPEAFQHIAQVGSPMTPDLEVITNLETDLLIGAKSLQSSLDKSLEGLNLTTAYLPTDSFEDLKLSFKVLGTYLGKEEKMNEVLSSILDKENELMKLAEGKELPRVLLMIGTSDSFMVMSENSYLGSLVKRLGAENIATTDLKVDSTYSAVNLEDIIISDPDIILVLASGDHGASEEKFKEEVAKNDAWTKLSAYKNEQIHILDYSTFGVTSIMNVENALTKVADYFVK